MKRLFLFTLIALCSGIGSLLAQPSKQYVTPVAQPDHEDWIYKCGETVNITLYAVKENVMMPNTVIEYSYGPEKNAPVFTGKATTDKNGVARIKFPGAKKPGFITVNTVVKYDGVEYKGMTNVGFEPYSIQPTTTLPDDFKEFWDKTLEKSEKVPMISKCTWSKEQSTAAADVYFVQIQSYRPGNYVYGVLTVPTDRKEGEKLPAILRLPGATVRAFSGPNDLAKEGFVILEIGVHGIPVNQDPEIYQALVQGSLAGYASQGLESRDTFYYKRVYAGCVRALDYLVSRQEVDSERIAVYGGSQGGMLSIVTSALDKRVKALVCQFPAFCDVTGYYEGRAGGWPHLFKDRNEPALKEKIAASKYFDTVNFARFVTIPGYYSWGFNDIVCCPSSTFSAYNVINAPKTLKISRDSGHWLYPVYVRQGIDWLKEQFGMQK